MNGFHDCQWFASLRSPLFAAITSISFVSPHVCPMWVPRTCGEPNETKKNMYPPKKCCRFSSDHTPVVALQVRGVPTPIVVGGRLPHGGERAWDELCAVLRAAAVLRCGANMHACVNVVSSAQGQHM